jgi:hypothetical protein
MSWAKDSAWGFDFTKGGKWHFIRAGKALCGKISLPAGTDLAPLEGQFPDRIKSCCRDCVVDLRAASRQPELFGTANGREQTPMKRAA